MNADIRYSQQDAAETGRRKGDVIRRASKPIADCPQPDGREIKLTDIVHPQLRFLPGMPSNDDHPTPPAMAGRAP